MARRRRANSVNSDLQPCCCQNCLNQNPEGLLIPQSTLTEHRHRERLRKTLPSRADRLQTVSTSPSVVPEASGSDIVPESFLHEDQSSPSENHLLGGSNHSNPNCFGGSHNPSPDTNDEDTGGWLQSMVSGTRMRLEILYDCETRLTFIKDPSPNISYVLSDHESLLQVNAGDFALKTTIIANSRFLDTESRLCSLLKTIQTSPLEKRLVGDIDVEEELCEALGKLHRIKERQWVSQVYPDGRDGSTFGNSHRFSLRQMTDATPILVAALIMHIKFRSPVRHMRVNLALLRGIIEVFVRRSGIQSRVSLQIPKDIHTIVDQYDLNPTLHVAIACPKCYALSPFTNEVLKHAEDAHEAHLPFPWKVFVHGPDSKAGFPGSESMDWENLSCARH
ncbi:hypothetical protein F5876DRAFT_84849 [Lentinula aff. lateritia]|uniref:Uncharacterized protein n=1 Tax=Lentinula aff. lateritia TaxID=2804960 RepID=A0ACC1TGS2_9AGAR|nr:hypothetical protein F5876DRAFT_84849 [Lentinula aff. lateritia]